MFSHDNAFLCELRVNDHFFLQLRNRVFFRSILTPFLTYEKMHRKFTYTCVFVNMRKTSNDLEPVLLNVVYSTTQLFPPWFVHSHEFLTSSLQDLTYYAMATKQKSIKAQKFTRRIEKISIIFKALTSIKEAKQMFHGVIHIDMWK